MKRGKSEQETLHLNGWGVGTLLAGNEGYGETVIEVTYLMRDGRGILAEVVSHKGEPIKRHRESNWTLACREWRCVGLVASQTATPEPLALGREWGVFRCDTGEQVGVGTTENHEAARDDLLDWERDGFAVVLRVRPVGEWSDV